MVFDSHNTNSPSRITGTSRLGFCASSCGSLSTCSKCRSSSAQVQSTLRTLIDEVRPRTRSDMIQLPLLPLYLLDAAVDDRDHHRRLAGAQVVHPALDHRLTHLGVAAGVDVRRAHVLDAAVARGGRAALVQQLLERGLLVDDPLAAAKSLRGCDEREQQQDGGKDLHGGRWYTRRHSTLAPRDSSSSRSSERWQRFSCSQ